MEIMGGLLRLDAPNRIPIPWYMRSHLGLATGTQVHLALTSPDISEGVLPDLIVSPIDPTHFDQTYSISITVQERVGALSGVLEDVHESINVALADSVTVDGRKSHRVNTVLEPTNAQTQTGRSTHERRVQTFLSRYSAGPNHKLIYERISENNYRYLMHHEVRVKDGFIENNAWFDTIQQSYRRLIGRFDMQCLVVSSNPDQRLLRYIIPKKGVFSIKVPHEDKPGVLSKISAAIAAGRYNILASRLSRTPPYLMGQNISVFVAECEPSENAITPLSLARNISKIEGHAIQQPTITYGHSAARCVHLVPRNSRIATQSKDVAERHANLREEYKEPKQKYRPQSYKKVVFISRRFLELWENEAVDFKEYQLVRKAIYDAIKSAGWAHIEAKPEAKEDRAFAEMYSRMWLASRFLIIAFDGTGGVDLSAPQGHELGFAMGQDKQVRILVPQSKQKLFRFPQVPDVNFLTYSFPYGIDESKPDSIGSKIREWLEN